MHDNEKHEMGEMGEMGELRRLAALGKQVENAAHEAAEAAAQAARDAAEAKRLKEALHAAVKEEQAEARAKFRRTLKAAGGAALVAAFVAGYGVLLGDAWAELNET